MGEEFSWESEVPEPEFAWPELEDAFAMAHRRGEHSDLFIQSDQNDDTEQLKLYIRQKPYNLLLGRPKFPHDSQGIAFYVQLTTPLGREDLEPELFAALPDYDRFLRLRGGEFENIGRRRTREIVSLVMASYMLPKIEFVEETGDS